VTASDAAPALSVAARKIWNSSLARSSAQVFLSSNALNGFAFLFYAVAARSMNVRDYGELYALMAVLAVAGIPASIAATAIAKHVAELLSLERAEALEHFIRRTSLAVGLAAVGACSAVIAFHSAIAYFIHAGSGAVIADAVLIAFSVALIPSRAILQGMESFTPFAVSNVLEGALKTLLGLYFVFTGWGITGAVWGYAAGCGIALLFTLGKAVRPAWLAVASDADFNVERLTGTLFGAGVLTATLNVIGYADVLLVKHYMPAHGAGLYASVSLAGKIVFFTAGFIPIVLLPRAVHGAVSGRSPRRMLHIALAAWGALCTLVLAMFFLAPAKILGILVGEKFVDAAPYLFPYACAMALLSGMNVVASYKIAMHRFDCAYVFALTMLGEMALIAAFHPTIGAVIATLVIGNAAAFLASFWGVRTPNTLPIRGKVT
jgi:O-antigen/teichoic acid export membrane protein